MDQLSKVLIITRPRSREAAELADLAERTLRDAGVTVERSRRERGRDCPPTRGTDLLIAVGGDGTVLRGQRTAAQHQIPVLGVSAGRLGFLAETDRDELPEALRRLLQGDYREEERSLLNIEHHREGAQIERYTALNDAVLARGARPRSVWISVKVDGALLGHYVADGIIAATATGSTAYSLAAGGPILAPEMSNILLTPIAPHLSTVHSTVLPEGSLVELSLVRPQDAAVSVDGQLDVPVLYGERLLISTSPERARFIRLSPPSAFYSQLVPRLQHNTERTGPLPPGSTGP